MAGTRYMNRDWDIAVQRVFACFIIQAFSGHTEILAKKFALECGMKALDSKDGYLEGTRVHILDMKTINEETSQEVLGNSNWDFSSISLSSLKDELWEGAQEIIEGFDEKEFASTATSLAHKVETLEGMKYTIKALSDEFNLPLTTEVQDGLKSILNSIKEKNKKAA